VIQRVGVADTIGLRQRVLRPHQTMAEMRYPHDDDPSTGHFAAVEGDVIIGTVSVVPELPTDPLADVESWWRLRGMATAEGHRSQGVGSALVAAAMAHVAAEGGRGLWCNARLPAVAFYQRAGFVAVGEPWEEPGIGPHIVMWRTMP
jgi:predicted GNAT family N-acyltransferase